MSLFLVRHGKTLWTEEKRFTGWGDARLSDKGLAEARSAAKALKASGYKFDICVTSCLERAKRTAEIIGNELNMPAGEIQYEWRLNERHYGALQRELRSEMVQKYGTDDVTSWRQNYRAIPPHLTDGDPRWREQLDRLPDIPLDQQPRAESMFQASERTLSFWDDTIAPALRAKKKVLIIAHTNSIRAIAGRIEGFNEAQLGAFRISTGVPRHYELDNALRLVKVQDIIHNPKAILRHWFERRRLNWLNKA